MVNKVNSIFTNRSTECLIIPRHLSAAGGSSGDGRPYVRTSVRPYVRPYVSALI